jgi:cell envelope opacity-associated protein A
MEQMMEHLLTKRGAMQENVVCHHEKVVVEMRAWRKEMKADQEAVEAYPEKMEANPEEMKSVVVHEGVPKEEAAVKTLRALKKRHGDQRLAVGCP